ncbi:hypothetical protein NL676_030066 [Syzygium grande]|nr:hypothetical protein NL676_030066 [Syzygium grande]
MVEDEDDPSCRAMEQDDGMVEVDERASPGAQEGQADQEDPDMDVDEPEPDRSSSGSPLSLTASPMIPATQTMHPRLVG